MGSCCRRQEIADKTTIEVGEWEVKIRRLCDFFKICLSLLVCLFLTAPLILFVLYGEYFL